MSVHERGQYTTNSNVLPVIPSKSPVCISSGVAGRMAEGVEGIGAAAAKGQIPRGGRLAGE